MFFRLFFGLFLAAVATGASAQDSGAALTNRAERLERFRDQGLRSGKTYEVRAVVKHPLITLYGKEVKVKVP